MLYFLKLSSKMSKNYVPILIISSLFKALTPFINIIMPKYIIDELLGKQRIKVFVTLVALTVVINGALNIINRCFDTIKKIKYVEIVNGFDLLIGEKIMDMDFEKIEDPEILNLKEKALFPIHNQGVISYMIDCTVNVLSQLITMLGLIAIISTLNVVVLLLIAAVVVVNLIIFKKSQAAQFKFNNELIPINRQWSYYAGLSFDFASGKDLRLYNITPLIMRKIKAFNSESAAIFSKLFTLIGKLNGLSDVNVQIQLLLVYGYMTYKVFKKAIGIGDFTMYISAANNFGTSMSSFINSFVEFRQQCRYLEPYFEFEGIQSSKTANGKPLSNIKDCTIEFKNVSFKYPRSSNYTLKNVSITIASGEKLSIVGLNGAGKTTFIKLLTRLYNPTEGEIFLNGVNINEYDYEEYMKLLSVVFQDFKLMAFSVKENIALYDYEKADDNKILNILDETGMKKDISKLPKNIYTPIYKTFEKDGIEFSGGQAQKLAIARALYKNSPIVILDEPTAALDPYAENEIYTSFNGLIGGKTAIYISHRLSSCKFCDKVAVFDNGQIIQYGSHAELIKDKGSQYETMYMAQAQYYV